MTIPSHPKHFSPPQAAVVGSTTIDRIRGISSDDIIRAGGVTTYAGLTYDHLGVKTHIISNISSNGIAVRQFLCRTGLQLHLGSSEHTTRFINQVDQDCRKQWLSSTASSICADPLTPLLPRLDWIHLGPLHPLDIDPEMLTVLAVWNKPVLLDVQGYTRAVEPDSDRILPEMCEYLPAALKTASMVKASVEEFDLIGLEMHIAPGDFLQRFNIDELIITRGASGGIIWSHAGPPVEYNSPTVDTDINPTGAGDVFFAAYAANRLFKRQSILAAAGNAAALAADPA